MPKSTARLIGLVLLFAASACASFTAEPETDPEELSNATQSSPSELEPSAQSGEQSAPTFTISTPPGSMPGYLRKAFSQYTNVFGVHLLATGAVSKDHLTHAAIVMAEYLDNDEDGLPDNPQVVEAMQANQATLVVFADERDERSHDIFGDDFEEDRILQNLYAEEMVLPGDSSDRFDFSLEEVLHLITHAGYSFAYPEVFGEQPGSAIAEAMDLARGGSFERVPSAYPEEAWYRYDDPTCEYNCQIAEYFYWVLTSFLGAQAADWRLEEIEHEWLLNTPAKLDSGDPSIFALLTDPQYALATELPDGRYSPVGN